LFIIERFENFCMKRKSQTTLFDFGYAKSLVSFTIQDSMLLGQYLDYKAMDKTAGFDFDGTLAKVNGTHVFPKNGNDFKLFHDCVPQILAYLYSKGYSIVIFSNQYGILDDANIRKKMTFQGRVNNLVKSVNKYCDVNGIRQFPMLFVAATEKDFYRKPRPGMWLWYQSKYFEQTLNLKIDCPNSFFVGDAAHRSGDHSGDDIKFAHNCRLVFYTPEQVFSSESQRICQEDSALVEHKVLFSFKQWHINGFDPAIVINNSHHQSPSILSDYDSIIMTGSPASGKSTFVKKLTGYTVISQDNFGSLQKCLKEATRCAARKTPFVIDNTNPTRESRKKFVDINLQYNLKGLCIYMATSKEICIHNNKFRSHGLNATSILPNSSDLTFPAGKTVPSIAIHTFWSKFEAPDASEGFELVQQQFIPIFDGELLEYLWKLHY
jgi:bifunctional polynucleotide phosphatase/kinase